MPETEHRHSTVIVGTRRLRDGFRRRYEVRCWHCDLRVYCRFRGMANHAQQTIEDGQRPEWLREAMREAGEQRG